MTFDFDRKSVNVLRNKKEYEAFYHKTFGWEDCPLTPPCEFPLLLIELTEGPGRGRPIWIGIPGSAIKELLQALEGVSS